MRRKQRKAEGKAAEGQRFPDGEYIDDAVRNYHNELWDHQNIFYDADDNMIVTYSPYVDLTVAEKGETVSISYRSKTLTLPG